MKYSNHYEKVISSMRQPKVLPLGEDLGGAAIAIAFKAQPHPLAVVHKNIQKFFP